MNTPHKPADRRATPVERHIQTIILAILTALIIWFGNTSVQGVASISAMEVKLENVEKQLDELASDMKSNMNDRYRGSDARRDFGKIAALIEDHEKRIDRLEKSAP